MNKESILKTIRIALKRNGVDVRLGDEMMNSVIQTCSEMIPDNVNDNSSPDELHEMQIEMAAFAAVVYKSMCCIENMTHPDGVMNSLYDPSYCVKSCRRILDVWLKRIGA